MRILLLAVVAGCSFDTGGPGGNAADARVGPAPDSRPASSDAAPPADAPPEVACESAADCQTPPDMCHLAGVCNLTLGICQFSAVDCSGLDDNCNIGVCDPGDGSCETTPGFEGVACAPSTHTGYTDCMFAMTCDLSGTRTRVRTDYTCSAGACAPADTTESDGCTRPPGDVNGDTCAADTCGDCSPCGGFSTDCDESGECVRSCQAFQCNVFGMCAGIPYTVPESCTRVTEGGICFTCSDVIAGCECSGGSCIDRDSGGG